MPSAPRQGPKAQPVEPSLAALPKQSNQPQPTAKRDAGLDPDVITSSADVSAFLQMLPASGSWCVALPDPLWLCISPWEDSFHICS